MRKEANEQKSLDEFEDFSEEKRLESLLWKFRDHPVYQHESTTVETRTAVVSVSSFTKDLIPLQSFRNSGSV